MKLSEFKKTVFDATDYPDKGQNVWQAALLLVAAVGRTSATLARICAAGPQVLTGPGSASMRRRFGQVAGALAVVAAELQLDQLGGQPDRSLDDLDLLDYGVEQVLAFVVLDLSVSVGDLVENLRQEPMQPSDAYRRFVAGYHVFSVLRCLVRAIRAYGFSTADVLTIHLATLADFTIAEGLPDAPHA